MQQRSFVKFRPITVAILCSAELTFIQTRSLNFSCGGCIRNIATNFRAKNMDNISEEKSTNEVDCVYSSEATSILNELCDRVCLLTYDTEIGSNEFPTVFEYRWPPGSSEFYVAEDLLAAHLKMTSSDFCAKHANLVRRDVSAGDELSYLLNLSGEFFSGQTCITVLRSDEVLNLLHLFYAEYLDDYKRNVIRSSDKLMMSGKRLENSGYKFDPRRIHEIRKKAMKSVSLWNSDLNRIRKVERPCFFDHQTTLIHYPNRKSKASCDTSFGAYPAALIPGQFQTYYKNYTTGELMRAPVSTVLDAEPFRPLRRGQSPGPLVVTESDLLPKNGDRTTNTKEEKLSSRAVRRSSKSSANFSMDQNSMDTKFEASEFCAFCCEELNNVENFVRCSKCGSCGHPHCLEMPDAMYQATKSYQWMCMECKPCSICSKLDGEDQMLFCDRCDRGYHTYCVGLRHLPDGHWICPTFCEGGVGAHRPTGTSTNQGGVAADFQNGHKGSSFRTTKMTPANGRLETSAGSPLLPASTNPPVGANDSKRRRRRREHDGNMGDDVAATTPTRPKRVATSKSPTAPVAEYLPKLNFINAL